MQGAVVRIVACAVLVGCGGGSSATTAPPPGNPGTPAGPVTAQVSVTEYAYGPSSVTIKVGETVTWTNNGAVAHTATADGGAWDTGQMAGSMPDGYGGMTSGASVSRTFGAAGTFSYHCANHPTQMKGTVTVTP